MSLYEGLEDDKDKGDSKADLCKYISNPTVCCNFRNQFDLAQK